MVPNKLKIGDTIGVIAPSKPITEEYKLYMNKSIKIFEDMGFKIKLSKNIYKNTYGYSATPEEKASDINEMFSNKDVKAIISAVGGDNSFNCLGLIDYENIKKNPKIICGYSDATNYLEAIYTKTGLITYHHAEMIDLGRKSEKDFQLSQFRKVLIDGTLGEVDKNKPYKSLQKGVVEGILVGGNVPSMVTLLNTEYFPDLTDKILFLEVYSRSTDFDLADRYLGVLKYHGVFDKIKGLWIGHYHGDTEDMKIEDVFMRNLKGYDFPILKCDDFGHDCENIVIPIGSKVRLDANNCKVEILEEK
ncbi:MAG: LD-carboxypeptidase [Clostridia bacterium]|nr:LD-carboxypeptidase [Clostridia bacterium]